LALILFPFYRKKYCLKQPAFKGAVVEGNLRSRLCVVFAKMYVVVEYCMEILEPLRVSRINSRK